MPWTRVAAYVMLLVALGLRIYRLDAQSFWFDEGFAVHLASQSVTQLVEQNPVGWLPLHSFTLHYWMALVGQTPFSARLFSVVFGVLAVALLFPLGRCLGTADTGIVALSIGAFSPFLVYYAQEARVYSLWLFLSLLSSYLLLRALRDPQRVWGWVLYGASMVAALYAHYFSVLLLPWGLLAVVYHAIRARRRDVVLASMGAQAAALVACLPLIGFARSSAADRYGFWRSPLSARQIIVDLWYHLSSGGNLSVGQAWPVMVGLAFAAAVGLVMLRPRWHGVLLALYFVIPLAGMLVLSSWRELYVSRYLAMAAPAVYLLVAAGSASLWSALRRGRAMVRGTAAATLALVVAAVAPCWAQALDNYYFSPQYARDDFRSAALYVTNREREGDALVMSGGGIYTALMPYYRGHLTWVDLPGFGEWLDEEQVVAGLNGLLSDRVGGRVWLVLSGNEITDPQNLIPAHLWTYGQIADAQSFAGKTGVRVLLFSPRHQEEGFQFAPLTYEPLTANFDDQVELVGFDIDDASFAPGEDIHLTLQWRALSRLQRDYHSFVHLLGGGKVVAGHDKVPLNQYFRPTAWPVGEALRDEYVLTLPADLAPGTYQVEVGLYSYPELERLPVVEGQSSQGDRVLLTPVIVKG
ncbi:MAG TPA: glycosyltransferase family 39 protein [Anaerolineae bacterium]|nr:glycosyltransferase family 39 protein [Anaerolineae bacterium]